MNWLNLTLLKADKIFGIQIFNDDFYKLVLLFTFNFIVTFVIGRLIYYNFNGKKRQFLFAYIIIATIVFFLCFALKAFKFNTGVAIGLFALLGIIRFRTDPIPIKEMSYLFVFIGLSMINAFSKKMSIYEIVLINSLAIAIVAGMEFFFHKKIVQKTSFSMELIYGNIDNIKPDKREDLMAELTSKTGLNVSKIKIGKVNLKTQEVELKVYYTK